MKIYCSHTTHKGLIRENNEDSILVKNAGDNFLLAVADGMGGHACGEVASNTIIEVFEIHGDTIFNFFSKTDLESALNHILLKGLERLKEIVLKKQSCYGMGTTLAVSVINEGKLFISHIGDSRVYHFRDGKVLYKTKDDTVAQNMVDRGLLSEKELKYDTRSHILTKCIGGFDFYNIKLELEYASDLKIGDSVLLCSDGLTDMVEEMDIFWVIADKNRHVPEKVDKLLDMALANGGHDNVSIILAECKE